ncbi:MAG TPA: DUF4430 domain-containing protein [Solirubrobacterales bacterium]|nr:DUF4430 domain-containing protein [Solirubrobacterales bacterium]
MTVRLTSAAAAAVISAAVVAGCGFGPGSASEGDATLTVTRDFGSERLVEATRPDPPESETVMRFLDSEADVATRYGGGFVQSIDGLAGAERGEGRFDWFFFVNGIESPVGAAEARVYGGDRVWWDYREWTVAMRAPAVVGSWPEPFAHGSEGKAFPVRIDCFAADEDCSAVAGRLEDEGVAASVSTERARLGEELLRVVVGPWEEVHEDEAAAQIEDGPSASGVFADLELGPGGEYELVALDPRDREVSRFGAGAGLVAAVRLGEQQPTWVVTGTDDAGVDAAIELLDAGSLRDRYAVAVDKRGDEQALPVVSP